MTQIIALLLAGLLCFGAAGCTQDQPEPLAAGSEPIEQTQPLPAEEPEPSAVWEVEGTARLSLLQAEYPVGTEKATLVIENIGDAKIGYGLHFTCVKFEDGQWSEVNYTDGLVFRDLLYIVEPHSVRTMALDWSVMHRPLDEGLYRVTGSKLWIEQDETDEATDPWQVEFRVTKDAQPEPDFALVVQNQPVSAVDEALAVHFINNTGADSCVQSIPHLERLSETGEWIEVPWKDNIGFCGMPDPLPVEGGEWSENIPLLWGALEEGIYRLSYQVGPGAEPNELVYGEFLVSAPELCGYPLKEQFEQVQSVD